MASYDEAVEVQPDDALDDLELFVSETREIRNIIQQIALLKSKSPDKAKEMIQELRIEGSFHFLTLKKLNRMAQIRCKKAKDLTTEAKQKLDGNNLRLQNLQYEITHFDREINNCLQFKSKHEDVDLISVDEFYAQAPKDVTKISETTNNEHLQMLARLDWELESRKKLDGELKSAHSEKEKICDGIKKRKQDLDSLRPSLETILKSTMPLQEALGDHYTETRALHDNACLLPSPLYVLFVQAKAFMDACDRNMEVQIGGDLDSALKVKKFELEKVVDARNMYKNRDDDESDSDNDEEQESDLGRRKSTAKASKQEPMLTSGYVTKHPLYVSLKIFLETKGDNSPYLLMRFYYYAEAELVTVVPSLELSSAYNDIKTNAVIEPSALLNDLQQADDGLYSNNEGKSKGHNDIILKDKEKAYNWAQKLAGLEAVENGSAMSNTRASFSNMRLVIKLIRKRVAARLALAEQINKFKSNIVECDAGFKDKYAPGVQFKLTSWTPIDFEGYSALSYSSQARVLNLVKPGDYFFLAILQRGSSARVTVAVALSDRYPKQWPLLNIQLQWRGDHTAENNLNIREMEVEINCRVPESIDSAKKTQNQIISIQIYRLLTLLDVYVETDSNTDGSDMPSEFSSNKLCPRVTKGRARLKPYKYNSRHKFQCY